MKLSTIWEVDRTVDPGGSSPLARELASRWRHDPGTVQFFRSSANFVYVMRRDGATCFLRFAPGSERQRADIEAEIDLLRWLDQAGLPVVQPIPSDSDRFVEALESEQGVFHAVLLAELTGTQYDIDELDDDGFRRWGASLGRLHAALRRYPNPKASQHRTWRDELTEAERSIPNNAGTIKDELNRLQSALSALPADSDRYGIIHGDFELDNLVWQDQTAQMLDFDDCKQSWFACDIAFALRDRFDSGASVDDAGVRAFLTGYALYVALPPDAAEQLPVFSRLASLLQYAKIVRSLDLDPEPDYPAWLTGLIDKLRARMQAYQTSLQSQ
jgi:Ser/Thr protein kinase RdoA (MazF antagonist)